MHEPPAKHAISLHEQVIVISGLPRSGTSMMMRMLEAGGLPILSDGLRTADEDNPKGYYEFERVKKLRDDAAWLADARGKAVKIISFFLPELPDTFRYKIILLHRAMPEVLASQRKMLERRGQRDATDDERMAALFEKDLRRAADWLESRANVSVLHVEHRDAFADPRAVAERVNAFLGGGLDVDAMAAAVDPALHRQRHDTPGTD
ncbi:MAG TPA: sulfotransferase [Candidatus Hydrogenedentes bacterium]|nr:sulfotransferase [Candidatus Hydrogenedentota bacterium]